MTGLDRKRADKWSRRAAFGRGTLVALRVPGAVLCATSMGYGALARDSGFEFAQTLLITAAFYALPAQVIFVDQMTRGADVLIAGFAVTLTAVRLLPMTVSMMPYLRDPQSPRWFSFLVVHFVAVTAWIEGQRTLPSLPPHLRIAHYAGIGIGMLVATLSGSAIGFTLSAAVPALLAATLLFMTPLYFMLSLFGAAAAQSDYLAIGLGFVLGPLFFVLFPGLDLLLTGLVGGTIAFLLWRRDR